MLTDEVDKLCIYAAEQDHACDAQGLPVGHAKAPYELGLFAKFLHGLRDLGSSSVNNDGMNADISQEHNILNEILQNGSVGHDRAADLEDHDGIIELSNIRQSLNEHLFSLNCHFLYLFKRT